MTKQEIKSIVSYIKALEKKLAYEGYRGTTIQLTELYGIIEQLMDETFKADQNLKPLLATLELKARKIKKNY